MFAVSTYKEIEDAERNVNHPEIVVLLFVKPTNSDAKNIIKEFEYIHYNSGDTCSFYAIGFTNDFTKKNDHDYSLIEVFPDNEWFFSMKAFVDFKQNLEKRICWSYSGEIEVLILQNNPFGKTPLDFTNYVAIDVNKGIREGYIDSFQQFMESLIRSSKSCIRAKEVIANVANSRLGIKNMILSAIDECKKIPKPVKNIIKDRVFYRSAAAFRK